MIDSLIDGSMNGLVCAFLDSGLLPQLREGLKDSLLKLLPSLIAARAQGLELQGRREKRIDGTNQQNKQNCYKFSKLKIK